jgi:hypothetical protein
MKGSNSELVPYGARGYLSRLTGYCLIARYVLHADEVVGEP